MFPLLYEVAAKLFIIPATSVPSERVFSVSGFVLKSSVDGLDKIMLTLSSDFIRMLM